MKSTFHAHQSLVLDSVAVCSFIDKREIGIFFFFIDIRSLGCGATVSFFHVFGDYLCPKYRATESKSFIRFLSDHPLNLECRKKKERKKTRMGMLYENHKLNPRWIIKWLVDHEYFFDNTWNEEFFFFFFTSISLNKKLQFRISRNDLAHKTTYIQHFLSKELALICFFILRKYFELLSQWQSIVQL